MQSRVKERNSAVCDTASKTPTRGFAASPTKPCHSLVLSHRSACASFSFRVAISSARSNDPDCAVNNAVSNILEGSEKHIATL